MATKKPTPKKAVKKATKTPDVKKKVVAKAPAKKSTPTKKVVAKPAPKKKAPAVKAKPVAKKKPVKKPVAKKVEARKVVAKPAPKKVKPAPKPVAKKEPAKKPVAVAKVKPIAKHKPAKKTVIPVKAKPEVKVATPASKPVAKKELPIKAKPVIDDGPIKTVQKKSVKAENIKDIKIPKTSVKTSVPYKPGYTPLENREGIGATELLVRYSDEELNEFRELILKKLEAAKKELTYLQGLITRKDDMGGDEAENRYMTMEDGSMSMEREQLSQMASRQITYIDHLEKAIIRIENKTYGICRVTGKLIDKTRLRAVPHATLSLEAKLGLAKPVLNPQ